jgi:hypothetical protein
MSQLFDFFLKLMDQVNSGPLASFLRNSRSIKVGKLLSLLPYRKLHATSI